MITQDQLLRGISMEIGRISGVIKKIVHRKLLVNVVGRWNIWQARRARVD